MGAILLVLAGCAQTPVAQVRQPAMLAATTTAAIRIRARAVILVRHADIRIADKATQGSKTELTPRGVLRAGTLVGALQEAGITKIYTSDALRTRQTAVALAGALKLTPETPFGHGGGSKEAEAAAVLQYLAAHATPEDTILVVEHHSVIPFILSALGFTREEIDEEREFDRAYVILPPTGGDRYRLLRLRYGETPAP